MNNMFFLSPKTYALIYRIVGMLSLWLLWVSTDSSIVGLISIIAVLILMLIRWRFKNAGYTLILDKLIYICSSLFWGNSVFGLVISTFDAFYNKLSYLCIPVFIYSLVFKEEPLLIIMIIQGAFSGFILKKWKEQKELSLSQMDIKNKKVYELEILKNDLLTSNTQVAKMAEISERSRISKEIHDNAGHDIISAYISLQVIENLLSNKDSITKELFKESMNRLEKGIDKIRETVHNLSPITSTGVEYIKVLCEDFHLCPISFNIYGDSSKVPVYLWSIIEPCVKESLTNIVKHSNAKKVFMTLDITPYIIRLSIENDGVKERLNTRGIGIRNLIQRANAVGGNISISASDKFLLVCVLPIK